MSAGLGRAHDKGSTADAENLRDREWILSGCSCFGSLLEHMGMASVIQN